MHYIVIPLRSEHTVADKRLFKALFERTLANIAKQTVSRYHVVLVCSETPDLGAFQAENITVIQAGLPVPRDRAARRLDMNTKIAIGAEHAFSLAGGRDFSIMKVDADDLIATDLLEVAEQLPDSNGFIINRGYLQKLGSSVLWKHFRFHEICGSCASIVMRRGGQTLTTAGEFADLYLKSIHPKIPGLMAAMGRPLDLFPAWGAIYTMDHGDNSSGNRIGFKWRPWRMQFAGPGLEHRFPGITARFGN